MLAVCPSLAARSRSPAFPRVAHGLQVISNLKEHFHAGQAVTVHVLNVVMKSDRPLLDLSLRISASTASAPGAKKRLRGKESPIATVPTNGREFAVGAIVPVRVVRVRAGRGLDVQLGVSMFGRAHLTELSDEWVQEPLASFAVGSYVRAVITSLGDASGSISSGVEVSLRAAAISAASSAKVDKHARPASMADVEAGDLVRGYVKTISNKGCFVSLARQVDGFVGVRYFSDEFIKAEDLGKLVQVGTLVVARALPRSGSQSGALPLTLRRSDVEGGTYVKPAESSPLAFEDLHPGMLIAGKVKTVTDFGIFVRLDSSKIDALCHKTEVRLPHRLLHAFFRRYPPRMTTRPPSVCSHQVSDKRVGDMSVAFPVGTVVKVAILRVNVERKQLSASMKRSRLEELGSDDDDEGTGVGGAARSMEATEVEDEEEGGEDDEDEDDDDDDDDDDDEDDEDDEEDEDGDEDEEDEEELRENEQEDDDNEDDGDDDDDAEADDQAGVGAPSPYGEDALSVLAAGSPWRSVTAGLAAQGLSGGFQWDDFAAGTSHRPTIDPANPAGGGIQAEQAADTSSRRGKRARESAAERDAEAVVAAREAEVANAEGAPKSAEDFERLLIGTPNSSYAWLRYMSFQLNLTEIERARQVGERALKTIELSEHKERFNIHAALINLEKAHGDQESLAAAMARALQGNDPKAVYMHLASVHERAGDDTLADGAFEAAAKKFRSHVDVWTTWLTTLMARNEQAAAKAVLQRSVDALPRARHIEVMSKFAQLEFRHGLAERGRTVFDGQSRRQDSPPPLP